MSLVWLDGRTRRPGGIVSATIWGIVLGCSTASHAGSIVQVGGIAGSALDGLGASGGAAEYNSASALSIDSTLTFMLDRDSPCANAGIVNAMRLSLQRENPEPAALLASADYSFIDCTGGGTVGAFDSSNHFDRNFLGDSDQPVSIAGIGFRSFGAFAGNAAADDNTRLLTSADLLAGGAFEFNSLVRFRGFADSGSEMIGTAVVPLPSALGLGLGGLGCVVGVALVQRLKRRAASGSQIHKPAS